ATLSSQARPGRTAQESDRPSPEERAPDHPALSRQGPLMAGKSDSDNPSGVIQPKPSDAHQLLAVRKISYPFGTFVTFASGRGLSVESVTLQGTTVTLQFLSGGEISCREDMIQSVSPVSADASQVQE